MKRMLTGALVALLYGCTHGPEEIITAQGEYACRDDGGLYKTYYDVSYSRSVAICNSGKRIGDVDKIVIEDPEYYHKQENIVDKREG